MKLYLRFLIIPFLLWFSLPDLAGQTALDSVILQRNKIYTDYKVTEEANTIKPWTKSAELTSKSKELIELDNNLINYYLLKEIDKNKKSGEKLDKLNFEIELIKKEAEMQDKELENNRQMITTLFIVAGSFCLLFIVMAILFIDRHIRFKGLKIEMERTWPLREEINRDHHLQDELSKLNHQLEDLNVKNASMSAEIDDLNKQMKEKDLTLTKELSSKKQIEEEIKKLIIQIKSQ